MKRDPVKYGNSIFQDILKNYPDLIRNIEVAQYVIENVINETEGWIIVDFIDYGGWDRLKKISIDSDKGLLYLIERESDKDFQPEKKPTRNRDGIVLKFKDVLKHNGDNFSCILIRGYSLKENEIRKIFSKNSTDFEITMKRNFAVTFERNNNNVRENFDVLNTPIYSVVILPKNTSLGYSNSQELLFSVNVDLCINRLEERNEQLRKIKDEDEDSICEKANTGRRIFETVLKVECCLIEHMVSFLGFEKDKEAIFKKDYNKLLLGDLKKLVVDFKPNNRQNDLNEIIRISNKLSHDSGEEILKSEAFQLFNLMTDYSRQIEELIKNRESQNKHYTINMKEVKMNNDVKFEVINFSDIELNK